MEPLGTCRPEIAVAPERWEKHRKARFRRCSSPSCENRWPEARCCFLPSFVFLRLALTSAISSIGLDQRHAASSRQRLSSPLRTTLAFLFFPSPFPSLNQKSITRSVAQDASSPPSSSSRGRRWLSASPIRVQLFDMPTTRSCNPSSPFSCPSLYQYLIPPMLLEAQQRPAGPLSAPTTPLLPPVPPFLHIPAFHPALHPQPCMHQP